MWIRTSIIDIWKKRPWIYEALFSGKAWKHLIFGNYYLVLYYRWSPKIQPFYCDSTSPKCPSWKKKPAHMHLMLSPDDACLVHDKERARMKQQVRALAPSSRQGPPCAVLFQELSFFRQHYLCFFHQSISGRDTSKGEKGRRWLHWSALVLLVVSSVQWQYVLSSA